MAKTASAPQPRQVVQHAPDHYLVVTHPFGVYRRGDMITDAVESTAVLAGPNKHHVNKVRAS